MLNELLNSLPTIDEEYEIIIVDSSDVPIKSRDLNAARELKLIYSEIKSAAVQRNIGLKHINEKSNYLFFLDDDIRVSRNYFNDLRELMQKYGAVGASGVAHNLSKGSIREKPAGLIGLLHRIFLLDSNVDGKLLKSGVNIPCRELATVNPKCDWLIACSAWKVDIIKDTRFEEDFMGASLAEDVIFSIKMKQKGTLVTSTNIILDHSEDSKGRPNPMDFWQMWVKNRMRVIKVANFGVSGYVSYWWANLGQALVFVLGITKGKIDSKKALLGLLLGASDVIWRNR